MARGDDGGKVNTAPPKRNPFKQDITSSKEAKVEKKKADQQASKNVASAIQADVREVFLKDAFQESDLDSESFDETYKKFEFEGEIKYPYIIRGRDELDRIHLQRAQEMQKTILNEVSDKLAELSAGDLRLADKLERVLLDQGESIFYLDQQESEWGYEYWMIQINPDSLRRLLRNLERTALLHTQDEE